MTAVLTPAELDRAAALLREGALVAFPTETVYGLGADARNAKAVAGIFEAKGRPHFNPLICHYPDAEAAFADVRADARARSVAAHFWPGPLTLVLPRRPDCAVDLLAGAGLDTLAVRVPDHPLALALLRAAGVPVAAPSANRSGEVSPTTAAHVLAGLSGRIAAVLDDGPCAVGVESTVLDLTGAGPVLLRPGGVPVEAIEAAARPGRPGPAAGGCRGDRLAAVAGDAAVALRARPAGAARRHRRSRRMRRCWPSARRCPAPLSPGTSPTTGDLREAAARLFAGLRWLDAEGSARGCRGIAAMPVPEAGLGAAINDRLPRAAAPALPPTQCRLV